MEKRYQIFVSSTFTDLKDERQAVLRGILELDQMPAGMELFPAADATAWQIIKDVIDSSDYYLLVIGGRYGSIETEGLGFTEREYDFATSLSKPVIPFLHQNPDNLPRERTDTDSTSWQKLQSFRSKVESRHTCVYWSTVDGLKASVIIGLTAAIKRSPGIGWIRADEYPSKATITEVLNLQQRIAELESQIETDRVAPPAGTEDLYQGNDKFEVKLNFSARRKLQDYPFKEDTGYSGTVEPAWNDIFAAVAPSMINETSQPVLKQDLRALFYRLGSDQWKDSAEVAGRELVSFSMSDDDIDTCIVQFRALGLIRESTKTRSIKDTKTYWSLTPYGDRLMTQLRALRRNRVETVTAERAPQKEVAGESTTASAPSRKSTRKSEKKK